MRRLALPCLVLVVLAAGCGGPSDPPATTGAAPPAPDPTSSATPDQSASPSPSADPSPTIDLPEGLPDSYADDVAGRDLPVEDLVRPGDDVTGVTRTRGPVEAVVITFATPGPDPFRQARGFVVWRRAPGADPPWRAVYAVVHGRRDGVLAISADATDLTDDGSADALIREETGGSGQCATYRVVDLAAGAPVWKRGVCDAEIQPNPDPIGLFEVARIYGPDDAHCCPSAIRERVLVWNGDRFVVVSEESTSI